MACYRKQLKYAETGIFDTFIDMTYVITMENAVERQKKAIAQLNKYKLSSNVTIMYNKGYKNCQKTFCKDEVCDRVDTSYTDLFHALRNVFNDAMENGYETILVLEDDFIISDAILEPDVVPSLYGLIQDYRDKSLFLRLGTLPILSYGYSKNFKKLLSGVGMHAVIYNKKGIVDMNKNTNYSRITDIDLRSNLVFLNRQLMYREPLINQIFGKTENNKQWGGDLGAVGYFWASIVKKYLLLTGLDTSVEPGTTFNYKYHNYITLSLLAIFIYVSVFVVRFILSQLKTNTFKKKK
uniref:Glycosyltransferase n=1 Tax=viral metagenome TaxID=1070528 RepID=A0A6C0F9B0_9ZZZZ